MTPQEQLNDLMDKIEKDPQNKQNWLNLAGIFLSNKLWDPFISLFNQREMMLQDGAELLIEMLFSETVAMVPPLHTALLDYDKTDLLSSNQLILRFAVSSMQINFGDIEKGRGGFFAISDALKEYPAFGEGLSYLNELETFADYFKTRGEIEKSEFVVMSPLNWLPAIGSASSSQTPVITTAVLLSDAEKIVEKFTSLFGQAYPIHFHVIGASLSDLEVLQKCVAQKGISFSSEERGRLDVCLFSRVGEILARHQRDILMLDHVIIKYFDLDKFFDQAIQKDITLFKDQTIIPWLSHNPNCIYLKNSEFTMQYLFKLTALLSAYQEDEGAVVSAVLNCLNQYAEQIISGGSVQLLDRMNGFKFEDFFSKD